MLSWNRQNIKIRTQHEKNVTGAFLDLSKAFDSTNHKILLQRLENIGFDKHATNLIENFFSERTQRVVLNGIESDVINLKRGVPQGTFLGPLLFNIYVNDLAKIVEKDYTFVQYADDTFLFTSDADETSSKTKFEHNISKIIDFFCKVPVSGEQTKNRIYCVQHQEEVNKYCSECRQWRNSRMK